MPTIKDITVRLETSSRDGTETRFISEYAPLDYGPTKGCGEAGHLPISMFGKGFKKITVMVSHERNNHFWIYYHIPNAKETEIFQFKLFVNGEHHTSWSLDKDDYAKHHARKGNKVEQQFKGRMSFSLAEELQVMQRNGDNVVLAMKSLVFGMAPKEDPSGEDVDPNEKGASIEVRVYRCRGRRPIKDPSLPRTQYRNSLVRNYFENRPKLARRSNPIAELTCNELKLLPDIEQLDYLCNILDQSAPDGVIPQVCDLPDDLREVFKELVMPDLEADDWNRFFLST
jgi:hypothetical protein